MGKRKKPLRWLRLDNAAKIYPAARRRNWSNLFRLSATLAEPVDKEVLQSALDVTAKRFPSLCARLRKGMFWYYLQELDHAPKLSEELKEKLQARFAPGKGEFVAAISLGYPDQAPKMPARREGRYTFV